MQILQVVVMFALHPLSANHAIIVQLRKLLTALLVFMVISMLPPPPNVSLLAILISIRTHGIIAVVVVILHVQPVTALLITLAFHVLV